MSELRKLQQDFTQYLTDNAIAIIDKVVDQGNIDRSTRLNIYQNAYNIRLKNCIETDHPMLGLYLGDDLFDQMVTGYIEHYPSHYPSLRQFCDHLPDYLTQHEPFKSFPIIAEIASFERRLMQAFDAADSDTATESELQNLHTEDWPEMKLDFHPSLQIFETHWNSVECWQALKNEEIPPESKKQQAYWIIWRDRERLTQYRNLTVDGFVLYQCFREHYTFADACELLKEHLPEDQIGLSSVNHLQSWFSLGIIRSLEI
jgi:hypothetical protein